MQSQLSFFFYECLCKSKGYAYSTNKCYNNKFLGDHLNEVKVLHCVSEDGEVSRREHEQGTKELKNALVVSKNLEIKLVEKKAE